MHRNNSHKKCSLLTRALLNIIKHRESRITIDSQESIRDKGCQIFVHDKNTIMVLAFVIYYCF